MIIGGLQTGNTRWLAAHLQNATDNEVIDHVETTGTIATDIDGALAEFDAITAGTRASEGVYACFINPPEPLTAAQYVRALAHIEMRLGLTGQPRIVVFHVKPDKAGRAREHCHCVWSRIDTKVMKAIHLSHDRQKLRRCARELAAEFGLELPPNLANDRGISRFEEPPQRTRAEKAMEAASGLSREERRQALTACYRSADSAQGFANALEAAGFMLARGDKRAYVVVDIAGHVHSLARQIDGAKTKDVKKKLEGLNLSLLPPVDRAKVLMLQRASARRDARRANEKKKSAARAEHERLMAVQRTRRAALDLLWQNMKIRQMHERKVLLAHILAEKERRIARRHFRAMGLALYLKKIAVIRQLIEYYLKRRQKKMDEQHRVLIEALRRRHDNEAAELRRRYAALGRLERREFGTFEQKFGGTGWADDDSRFDPYNFTLRYETIGALPTIQPVNIEIEPSKMREIDAEATLAGVKAKVSAITGKDVDELPSLPSVRSDSPNAFTWAVLTPPTVEFNRVAASVAFASEDEVPAGEGRDDHAVPPVPPPVWPGAP